MPLSSPPAGSRHDFRPKNPVLLHVHGPEKQEVPHGRWRNRATTRHGELAPSRAAPSTVAVPLIAANPPHTTPTASTTPRPPCAPSRIAMKSGAAIGRGPKHIPATRTATPAASTTTGRTRSARRRPKQRAALAPAGSPPPAAGEVVLQAAERKNAASTHRRPWHAAQSEGSEPKPPPRRTAPARGCTTATTATPPSRHPHRREADRRLRKNGLALDLNGGKRLRWPLPCRRTWCA